jgi:hypothetical protein
MRSALPSHVSTSALLRCRDANVGCGTARGAVATALDNMCPHRPALRLIQAMWTHRSPITNNASRTKRSADFAKPTTARRVSAAIHHIGSPTASAGETLMRSATNASCPNDRWRPRKARWRHRAPPQGQGANATVIRVNPRPSMVKSGSGFASICVHSRETHPLAGARGHEQSSIRVSCGSCVSWANGLELLDFVGAALCRDGSICRGIEPLPQKQLTERARRSRSTSANQFNGNHTSIGFDSHRMRQRIRRAHRRRRSRRGA